MQTRRSAIPRVRGIATDDIRGHDAVARAYRDRAALRRGNNYAAVGECTYRRVHGTLGRGADEHAADRERASDP
jgi:hypothetical protein